MQSQPAPERELNYGAHLGPSGFGSGPTYRPNDYAMRGGNVQQISHISGMNNMGGPVPSMGNLSGMNSMAIGGMPTHQGQNRSFHCFPTFNFSFYYRKRTCWSQQGEQRDSC